MRYLRMLSNSLAGACLGVAYVLALVLHLNPTVPLHPAAIVPLVETVGLFYAFHLTSLCYILLVIRQLLAREVFSPAWISVGVQSWFGAIGAAAGAALMWANVQTFGPVLDAATADALDRSAAVLAAAAVLCVAVALLRHRHPRPRFTWAMLLVAINAAAIAAPVALRGRGSAPLLEARPIDVGLARPATERIARVTLIALDAGSLDFITAATAEGRLPNFGRVLDAGAVRHLATIHPTSAEAVWAAVATGKLPQKNGVRSAGIYELKGGGGVLQLLPDYCFAHALMGFGLLVEQPHTSATIRSRTLWSILSTMGVSVGVIAWPLTQPAPVVRGFLVSDTYDRLAQTTSGIDDPSMVYPPELQQDALTALESGGNDTPAAVTPVSLGADARYEAPGRTDRAYDRIARAMAAARPVQVMLTRFQSLDPIGHYFLRYAVPSEFGDVSDDERRRLGPVLERHYALVDEAIGRAIATLGPDDLLLVVSGYGMEPIGIGRRLVERVLGDPEMSGAHDAAPDGFLIAYGAAVKRGRVQARASVLDVTPTILYFLGLPVGRDMDGYTRTDIFQTSFTEERPITFIPTYDR